MRPLIVLVKTRVHSIVFYPLAACTLDITGIQLELGNKATDWSPAPEDVDNSITTAQQAAQTYATTNCVKTDASNAPSTILNSVLANTHGNFTYIDGNSVYTGTLTANQVNAVGINASSISVGTLSADRLAANSIDASKLIAGSITAYQIASNTITGDKIVGNTITADKIQTNTITSLGAVTAGSFNLGNGKFIVDANGNLTATGATIKGSITTTSGSVGGWTISNNSLSCSGTSAKLNVNPSSSSFLNINESPDTLMHIRADGATGVNIYTQDGNGVCLHMNAQASGSLAIDSYGSAKIISRATEGTVINGLSDAVVVVTSGGTIGTTSSYIYNSSFCPNYVLSFATGTIDMYMPYYTNVHDGQIIRVRKCYAGNIVMHANGSLFYRYADGSTTENFTMQNYDRCEFVYCASKGYWIVN